MSTNLCELCASSKGVTEYEVKSSRSHTYPSTAMLCETCRTQCDDLTKIIPTHWHALNESIWSENPAVKVLAWRVLNRLLSERWAQDLMDQLYLEDELLDWAKETLLESATVNAAPVTRDSNGTVLVTGDSVTLIKDLEVKGANFTAKRGTLVKNITVTSDPGLIEGRVGGTVIVLKTVFLKKA